METSEILDTSIAVERSAGTVTLFTVIEHPRAGGQSFNVLLPETNDYLKAIQISDKLREKGTPIGAIDILIAAMCLNRSAKLLTKDKDFKVIQDIFPEFKLTLIPT